MFELIKVGNQRVNDLTECKLETNAILNRYYSVNFFLNAKRPSYLFKLRYDTSNEPYILVKQNSFVFDELMVGDIMEMEYNKSELLDKGKFFKTLITSKVPHGSYRGHFIVELSIIDN